MAVYLWPTSRSSNGISTGFTCCAATVKPKKSLKAPASCLVICKGSTPILNNAHILVQYQRSLHSFCKTRKFYNCATTLQLNVCLSPLGFLPIESPQRPRPQLHSHPATGWPACRAPSPWRPRYHGAAHPPATPERMERSLEAMERWKLKIMLRKLPQSF